MGFPHTVARPYKCSVLERLWLLYFPLLFLPNLGLERPTALGTLQISDYLLPGYLLLALPAAIRNRKRKAVDRLTVVVILFAFWATMSTLSIPLRYSYGSQTPVLFGFLKIAKFLAYMIAGLVTVKAYGSSLDLPFHWALLAAVTVMGIAIWAQPAGGTLDAAGPYRATNAVSVTMGVLMVYLASRYAEGYGSKPWRRAALIAFVPTLIGFVLSEGRGGWLAFIAGLGYYVVRRGLLRRSSLLLGAAAVMALFAVYQLVPPFRQQVDRTLHPPAEYVQQYPMAVAAGIDVGARPYEWASEAVKLVDSPLLGTGFYHRGGLTRLAWTGSHNFFLQMFLETGLPGGLLILAIFVIMWRQARGFQPLKAALVAATLGGFGGEYFYGGLGLFVLLAVYAPVGSKPVVRSRQVLLWRQPGPGTAIESHSVFR